jgi:hypothetical protein
VSIALWADTVKKIAPWADKALSASFYRHGKGQKVKCTSEKTPF